MLSRRNASLVPVRGAFDTALDRMFRDVFAGFPAWDGAIATSSYPAVNAWEDEKEFHVEAELPGFEEKDITVTVLGNELRLAGKREQIKDESSKVVYRERYHGEFARVLQFPVEIDDSKIDARFKNGLLTITLPKAAVALPRKIEVKS